MHTVPRHVRLAHLGFAICTPHTFRWCLPTYLAQYTGGTQQKVQFVAHALARAGCFFTQAARHPTQLGAQYPAGPRRALQWATGTWASISLCQLENLTRGNSVIWVASNPFQRHSTSLQIYYLGT